MFVNKKSLVKSLKILKIFIFRCSRVGTCSQKYVEKKNWNKYHDKQFNFSIYTDALFYIAESCYRHEAILIESKNVFLKNRKKIESDETFSSQ